MNRNTIFFLSLTTFITILAWIGFSVYHSYTTSTISETENLQIAPIDPDFDTQTIQSVLQRKQIVPVFELSPQATQSGQLEVLEASSSPTIPVTTPTGP